jgi:hypothetical protein
MTIQNVTESHFGQNRNETERFMGPGMRPNQIPSLTPTEKFERNRSKAKRLATLIIPCLATLFPITGGYEFMPEKKNSFFFITSCRNDRQHSD